MKQYSAAEISPNMADNWALVIPDHELRKQDKTALNANLVVFARAGNLTSYEERIRKILNTNGLDTALKLAAESASATEPGDQGSGSTNGVAVPPLPPKTPGSGPPPIPGFGGSANGVPTPPSQRPSGPPIPGFGNNPAQNNNGPTPPPWLPGQDRK